MSFWASKSTLGILIENLFKKQKQNLRLIYRLNKHFGQTKSNKV